jgi:uncharacterized repeat protein (TIGR02543 family)
MVELLTALFNWANENPVGKAIISFLDPVFEWFDSLWAKANITFLSSEVAFFIIFNLLVLIVLSIFLKLLFGKKKKKITFMVDGVVYATTKAKYKKKIKFPAHPVKEGCEFVGWFTDRGAVNQYVSTKMTSKKPLTLYACFEDEVVENNQDDVKVDVQDTQEDTAVVDTIKPVEDTTPSGDVQTSSAPRQVALFEEEIEHATDRAIGELYDELRVEMLCYTRAKAFNDLGLYRKHIIAEMFEKDGVVNLYLAIDPALMTEKGFKVEKYSEEQFKIVPCRKIVKTEQDYVEAVALIKETMTLNNLVKSDLITVSRTQSDARARRSGFAFFVKNEQVAMTAVDYYKILRQNVLCYSASPSKEIAKDTDNKMILKIFKKDEEIFVYLALNAEKEGLDFVGFDKNFVETPAMLKVNTFEDVVKAFYLIDKLMYRFGMEKFPENGEPIGTEQLEKNCGFGYRIRH